MKNEENRGLIYKKASKDQLVTFCQFRFKALSFFSLSLSHTLGHLEFSWNTLALEQETQRRQEETRIKQLQQASLQVSTCMCIFLTRFRMHVLHVVLFYHDMGFSRCNSVFNLAFPFLDSHGFMGFSCLAKLDCQMDSKLSKVDV